MPLPERLRHRRSSRGPADAEIRKEELAIRERRRVGVAVAGIPPINQLSCWLLFFEIAYQACCLVNMHINMYST